MNPMDRSKKPALIIGIGPKEGPPPLSSPEDEPDEDDAVRGGDTSNQSCATCYAFRPSDGRCQRFPPHGMDWSQVEESDWCCEYRQGKQHDSQQMGQERPAAQQDSGGMPNYSMRER